MAKPKRWLVRLDVPDDYYGLAYRVYEGTKPVKTKGGAWPLNKRRFGPFEHWHVRGLLGFGFALPPGGGPVELP